MDYKVTDIVKDVRITLDNNSIDQALLTANDVDTLQLDELIRSKIKDALRYVLCNADNSLLGFGTDLSEAKIKWNSDVKGVGSGKIKLPEDFLRLIVFKMTDWDYPVTVAIDANDPSYAEQHSRYAGVRGCPQRPVVAIVSQGEGLMLEFFSCMAGKYVRIDSFRYIALPQSSEDLSTQVEIPFKLYDAVIYYTSFLVAVTLEMPLAASLAEIAKTNMKWKKSEI